MSSLFFHEFYTSFSKILTNIICFRIFIFFIFFITFFIIDAVTQNESLKNIKKSLSSVENSKKESFVSHQSTKSSVTLKNSNYISRNLIKLRKHITITQNFDNLKHQKLIIKTIIMHSALSVSFISAFLNLLTLSIFSVSLILFCAFTELENVAEISKISLFSLKNNQLFSLSNLKNSERIHCQHLLFCHLSSQEQEDHENCNQKVRKNDKDQFNCWFLCRRQTSSQV